MSISTTSSSNYYKGSPAAATGPPFTVSCWFLPTVSGSRTIWNLHQNGVNNEYYYLASQSASLNFRVRTSSGISSALTSNAPIIDEWNHGFAVASATDARRCMLNGDTVVSNTTDRSPTGLDRTTLISGSGVAKLQLDGRLADLCFWDVALSDDEGARLALGVNPFLIRPGSITHFWRCYKAETTIRDLVGTIHLPQVGSVTSSPHPARIAGHPFMRVRTRVAKSAVAMSPYYYTNLLAG